MIKCRNLILGKKKKNFTISSDFNTQTNGTNLNFSNNNRLVAQLRSNPKPDVELLYSEFNELKKRDEYKQDPINEENEEKFKEDINSSDSWIYYNPNKNSNIYFALICKNSKVNEKLEILKINKLDNTVTKCASSTTEDDFVWNDYNLMKDVKVIYTNDGDYAYMCTEKSYPVPYDEEFKQKVVHIFKLDTLYEDNTFKCVNTIPGISYHNLLTFQSADKNVAYLYGVGGDRNALEIYDLSINPEKPFYLGGYLEYPNGYKHTHGQTISDGQDDDENKDTLYIHDGIVSDNIPGLGERIILFGACIHWTSIIVLDVTNPINVESIVSIVDPRFQKYNLDKYGLPYSLGISFISSCVCNCTLRCSIRSKNLSSNLKILAFSVRNLYCGKK